MAGATQEQRLLGVDSTAGLGRACLVRLGVEYPSPSDANTMGALSDAPFMAPRRTPVHAYRITSSAWKSSVGGTVRSKAFAALRLMTSSNCMGCSIGRSPGLAPLHILST